MIIGLCGYAGSGKDTVAKSLILRHNFNRSAFADKLKEVALEIDPWLTSEDGSVMSLRYAVNLFGWERVKQTADAREFLQNLGEAMRGVDPSIWIRPVGQRLADDMEWGRNSVITDVRYPNEVEFLKMLGAKIVRIDRPGVGPVNDHVSDNELTKFEVDAVFQNDMPLRDLGNAVTEFFKSL